MIAARLLPHLRALLDQPGLEFAESPSPVTGGFDTKIFAFRLRDAPPAFAGPLILRLLGPDVDPARVLRERAVQNTVAGLGYPAPRVVHASADAAVLGGGFLLMDRLRGRVLPDERLIGMSSVLVELHHRLHALDAEALLRALDAETPRGRSGSTFPGHLGDLERRTSTPGLDGLRPISRWLLEHQPAPAARPVICHGDFHPLNILMDAGRVTGVIDWPNALVADPAYDVAATRTILAYAPVDLAGLPVAARWVARAARRLMLHRYVSGYRARSPLDRRAFEYYEVAACMRALVRVAEARASGAVQTPERARLEAPAFTDALLLRVAQITGLRPSLPPP